jgi:hypothetical protein
MIAWSLSLCNGALLTVDVSRLWRKKPEDDYISIPFTALGAILILLSLWFEKKIVFDQKAVCTGNADISEEDTEEDANADTDEDMEEEMEEEKNLISLSQNDR